MSYVRRLFEEERNCGSDKENEGDSSHPIQSPKKKLLGESNGVSVSLSPKVNNNRSFKEEEEKPRSLVCTANEDTCCVHNRTKSRTKWLFYYKESDIDELINCLNKRGYREHRLRKILIEEKDRIVPRLGQCPVNLLNPCLEVNSAPIQNVTKFTRSQRFYENANLKYPPGTPIQEILELYIRELILDTEEKIYCGGLGSLKVKNRIAWREAIQARSYDKQDDDLTWNQCPTKKDKIVEKIKEEDTSRPETPCSIDSNTEHDILTNKSDQNQTVRDLATAVLQIARSIEPKYLQKPLTHEKKKDKSMMDKWESSLMCSTSFAQVYLHIATLENSIQWNKSALNARCKVCRKGGDGENMLLCDGCDRGFHLYCLKPKLTSIPEGDWFCLACKPKEKVERTTKRSRRLFSEDSDNDEPLITLRNKRSKTEENPNKRKLRKLEEDDDDSSDEPLAKMARRRSRKSDAD